MILKTFVKLFVMMKVHLMIIAVAIAMILGIAGYSILNTGKLTPQSEELIEEVAEEAIKIETTP
jgi:hypothetical protein